MTFDYYALEAQVVDPASQAFRLGFSRLDVSPLDGTTGTGFILDQSRLNEASLASSVGYIWKDFTGNCTGITSRRGSALKGQVVQGSVGTLTATFKNGGDTDLSINLGVGTPVRLRKTDPDFQTITVWTGVLADTSVVGEKGSSDYRVTWSCVDVMSHLAQKVSGLPAQSFALRMNALAGMAGLTTPVPSANDMVWAYADPGSVPAVALDRYDELVPLSAVTDSLSIAEHMDMACASTKTMYFVGQDGNILASPNWGPGTALKVQAITDNADWSSWLSAGDFAIYYTEDMDYTSVDAGLNSATICNVLNVTNKGTGNTFSVTMAESVARYGRREQSITVCTTTDANARIVASDYLRTASENVFSATQFTVHHRFNFYGPEVDPKYLDPLCGPVTVFRAGKAARAWIINEQISIKPKLTSGGQDIRYTYQLAPRELMYGDMNY